MNTQFIINEKILYINSAGILQKSRIINIHYDTPPELYYTIRLKDGSIKQTIHSRLKKNNKD
jgi:hypothetical protein